MEVLVGVFHGLGQLAGMVVTVPGSLYLAESWRGDEVWAEARERAQRVEVSLVVEDYAPPKLKESDDLMEVPAFRAEIEGPRERRLEGWSQVLAKLPGGKHGSWRLQPATGKSPLYQEYFEKGAEEEAAREKVAELMRPFEKRFDVFGEALLSKPRQAVYARLENDQDASIDYLLRAQGLMECGRDAALMAIRSKDPGRAIKRMRVIEHLAETFREANLIGALIDQAGKSLVNQLIWEGVRLRVWGEEDLKQLAELVSKRESEENLKTALSYEAAWVIDLLQQENGVTDALLVSGDPKNIEDLFSHWWYFEGMQGWRDHRKARVADYHLDLLAWFETAIEKRGAVPAPELKPWWSPVFQVDLAFGMMERSISVLSKVGPTKDRIVLAAMACERHFMKEGSYPESLSDLKLPFSVIDLTDPEFGELAYERGPKGRPVIWSEAEEAREDEPRFRRLRWQFSEFSAEEKPRK